MAIQTQFSTDPNAIVTVHVSLVEAPTPNTYQRSGALVSFGATTIPANDQTQLLTQMSDLDQWFQPDMVASTTAWAAGTTTVQFTAPIPGPPTVGDTIQLVLSGFTPA